MAAHPPPVQPLRRARPPRPAPLPQHVGGAQDTHVLQLFLATGNEDVLRLIHTLCICPTFQPVLPTRCSDKSFRAKCRGFPFVLPSSVVEEANSGAMLWR